MLDQLTKARDVAQDELAQAEIALLHSTAKADGLREEVRKLQAAVAALSGEELPTVVNSEQAEVAAPKETPGGPSVQNDIHEMSPEEFDAQRKKRQRQRQKEEDALNPYAEVPCGGCGTKGSLHDSMIQAPSGAVLNMLVCSQCNNQIMK